MPLPLAAVAALSAAPGILGGLYAYNMAGKTTAGQRGLQSTVNNLEDLRNLAMNPNDPRYQSMLDYETKSTTQGLRNSFLQNLNDAIEANRRQAVLGRQQLFDPERQDESIFNLTNQANQQAQLQGASMARQNVLNRLNSAIQNLQSQQQAYSSLADMQNAQKQQKMNAVLGGVSALGKAGSSLGGLFG